MAALAGNFEHGTTVLHSAVELEPLEEARLEGWRERLLAARARLGTTTSSPAGMAS
jgi:hypothetical protein